MKAILSSLVAICLTISLSAQTRGTIKLYGYKQSVSGGKAPDIIEGSSVRTSTGAGKNYFIYAASTYRIYPSEIWIEGIRYGVHVKLISNTPVEYSDEANIGSSKKVLVPATTKKVIQLIPVTAVAIKSVGTKAKSLSTTNELVVVYKQNGKFYYTAMKYLGKMESAAMQ